MVKEKPVSQRSAARLAVVSALYQLLLTEHPIEQTIKDFLQDYLEKDQFDQSFFLKLLRATYENKDELAETIGANLTSSWHWEKMELIFRALLLPAAYEMLYMPDVPPKVIINEYVNLTKEFADDAEAKMVNAVLDKIAHVVRGDLS